MDNLEKRYVLGVYCLLIAIIFVNPFIDSNIFSTTIFRSIQLACIIAIIVAYIRIKGWRNLKGMQSKWLIIINIAYTLEVIFRNLWTDNILRIAYNLVLDKILLAYITSIIILSLPNKKYFAQIIFIFFIGSLLTIPLWLLNMDTLVFHNSYRGEHIGLFFPFFAGFLLSLTAFFNRKERLLIWSVWGTYFLLMLLNARRNVCFSFTLYALISFIFYIYYKRNNVLLVLMTCLLLCISLCIINLNWDTLTHDTFGAMNSRLFEDTRSGVERNFMNDFKKAPIKEWLFGRGTGGTYYQSTPFYDNGKLIRYRPVIETGYLNLILKGGITYMVIIILLIFVGTYRCFQSTNRYIKYIGVFLLTYVIDLYSANPIIPYSVRSILFWFCISIAFSKPYYNQAHLS